MDKRCLSLTRINNQDWRRDLLARQGFSNDFVTPQAVLDQLCYAQLDSIKTVERSQHCILHNRLDNYKPDDLDDLVKKRLAFENWTHDACVLPMDLYPYIKLRFRREAARTVTSNWWKNAGPDMPRLCDFILCELREKGALPLQHFTKATGSKPENKGMWQWSPVKSAMEHLWRTGGVSICHRKNFNKVYDLPERVVPKALLDQELPDGKIMRHLCRLALARLGVATVKEVADFWGFVKVAEAREVLADFAKDGEIEPVKRVQADGANVDCVRAIDSPDSSYEPVGLKILSPFDPLVRNRDRLSKMFGFDYRFEAYTPAAKRRYGYYVFPVLENDTFTGRIDMSIVKESKDRVLEVRNFWPEPGIRLTGKRQAALKRAVKAYARLGGVKALVFAQGYAT